jgi:DNA-binding response OmpR family regulator
MATSLLLVDESRDAAERLATVLRLLGYDVHAASSGSVALRLASDMAFKAAIMELKLPDMRGDQLALMLRELRPEIQLVALTRYPAMMFSTETLGCFDRLWVKPLAVSELSAFLGPASPRRPRDR